MGVVIFTRDAATYRVGDYVEMWGELSTAPTAPDVTFILHSDAFKVKDAEGWADLITYRLVVVTTKEVTFGADERIFGDKSLKERTISYRRYIEALFRWTDRDRVLKAVSTVPLPLIGAFVRVNRADDIDTARRVVATRYTLPNSYLLASLAYSIEPRSVKVVWPTKKQKKKVAATLPFTRPTDIYAATLVGLAPEIRNNLRDQHSDSLPKGTLKGREGVTEWL